MVVINLKLRLPKSLDDTSLEQKSTNIFCFGYKISRTKTHVNPPSIKVHILNYCSHGYLEIKFVLLTK